MPFGKAATTESNSAVAGMLPVEPAAITGSSGGRARQARAWASSKRRRRSAGPIQPSSACTAGHCSVRMARNFRVICQCAAYSSGANASSRAKSSPSVST